MDGLTYGIADCIGSQRDLYDVQMDGEWIYYQPSKKI